MLKLECHAWLKNYQFEIRITEIITQVSIYVIKNLKLKTSGQNRVLFVLKTKL